MLHSTGKRGLFGGIVLALVLSALLSLGAIFGLNRYLGPIDEPQTTGSTRHPTSD